MRAAVLAAGVLVLAGCAPAYDEVMPESSWQWERRQEEIARREAERQRVCALMDKTTERYQRDCTRPGDPD